MNNQPPFTPGPETPPAGLPGEVQAAAPRPASSLTRTANNVVIWVARHWLAVFNSAWAIYVLLPFMAPVLMAAG